MDDDCDVGSELNPDDCSDRRFGFADKRSGLDVGVVAVVAAERKEFVAVAVEMGVSLGQILEEAADTPEMLLPGDADERSSHLVKQKTWE